VANQVYNEANRAILQYGTTGRTYKVMLVDSTYSPSASHTLTTIDDDEVSGTGYTAGGATLTNFSWSGGSSQAWAACKADNTVWTGIDVGTVGGAVIYEDSSDLVVAFYDFDPNPATNGGTLTIDWDDTSGWVKVA
jgi:hypothetical protein